MWHGASRLGGLSIQPRMIDVYSEYDVGTRGHLYHQKQDGTFEEVSPEDGIDHPRSHGDAHARLLPRQTLADEAEDAAGAGADGHADADTEVGSGADAGSGEDVGGRPGYLPRPRCESPAAAQSRGESSCSARGHAMDLMMRDLAGIRPDLRSCCSCHHFWPKYGQKSEHEDQVTASGR